MAKKKKVAVKTATKKKIVKKKAAKKVEKKTAGKKALKTVAKKTTKALKKKKSGVDVKKKSSSLSVKKKSQGKPKDAVKTRSVKAGASGAKSQSKVSPGKKVSAKKVAAKKIAKARVQEPKATVKKHKLADSELAMEGGVLVQEDTASAATKVTNAKKGPAPASSVVVPETEPTDEEIIITDAEGRRYCKVRDCDQIAVVDGYCRYHYLAMWKRIQQRRMILSEGKLEKYIDELTARFSDKYLEIIRKDLRSPKDFMVAIQELEIDENQTEGDFEEDEARSFIEEMRGVNDNKQEDDY
jgi:hypothetical protein